MFWRHILNLMFLSNKMLKVFRYLSFKRWSIMCLKNWAHACVGLFPNVCHVKLNCRHIHDCTTPLRPLHARTKPLHVCTTLLIMLAQLLTCLYKASHMDVQNFIHVCTDLLTCWYRASYMFVQSPCCCPPRDTVQNFLPPHGFSVPNFFHCLFLCLRLCLCLC